MQMAIADDEVSNVASEYQLRTMDIPVLTPSPYIRSARPPPPARRRAAW